MWRRKGDESPITSKEDLVLTNEGEDRKTYYLGKGICDIAITKKAHFFLCGEEEKKEIFLRHGKLNTFGKGDESLPLVKSVSSILLRPNPNCRHTDDTGDMYRKRYFCLQRR